MENYSLYLLYIVTEEFVQIYDISTPVPSEYKQSSGLITKL
jgi:hypothetical protein